MTRLIQLVQQETDALFLAQQSPKHFDASTVIVGSPLYLADAIALYALQEEVANP